MPETEKSKLKQSIRNNKKYYIPLLIFILGILLSWSTWVTNGIYTAKANMKEVGKILENVNKDLKELKQGQKEMREEIKEDRELVHKGQKDMLELLLSIKKRTEESKKK